MLVPEKQPGACLLASLLARPEGRQSLRAGQVAQDVPGAEARAEPHPRCRCQSGRRLGAGRRMWKLLELAELLLPLVKGAVVGEQGVVQAGHCPDDPVSEIVDLVCARDDDSRRNTRRMGNLAVCFPQVHSVQPRRLLRLLLDTGEHSAMGRRRKLIKPVPADNREIDATIASRLQRVGLHRQSPGHVKRPARREAHKPVHALVRHRDGKADIRPVGAHHQPERAGVRQPVHGADGLDSESGMSGTGRIAVTGCGPDRGDLRHPGLPFGGRRCHVPG